MSAYPGALDALATDHVDNVGEKLTAAMVNDIAGAVNAIESTLGVDPQGTSATVVERLDAIVPGGGQVTTIVVAASNAPAYFAGADYVCDGVDDHVQINQAMLDAKGGGRVVLSPGTFNGGQLVIQDKVWLSGAGMRATTYTLKNAVNADALVNYVSADGVESNAEFCTVSDLMLDCNKAGQTAGAGIHFTSNPTATKATNDTDFDTHQRVENVEILNAFGDGFLGGSRSEMRLKNVYAMGCNGHGFNTSYDTWLEGCTAAWAGRAGFYLQSSSVRVTTCKAFYCGQVTPADGKGFWVKSIHGVVVVNCEAQDNFDVGFLLDTCTSCVIVGSADSNSRRVAGLPGMDIWGGADNIVDVACYERGANGVNQTHGLRVRNASTGNSIRVSHAGVAGIGTPIDGASTGLNLNDITVNGGTRFAALPTADPHVAGQLWANAGVVTVSAG